ncbi:hypothetical protein N9W34_01305 [Rickettsiales bacterium]|nr:hypothetical protein [Rickettsiales bacterium]
MEDFSFCTFLDLIWQNILSFFHGVSTLFNSNFGVAATGSFFGAVGGYTMVLYTNKRAEIIKKIRGLKTSVAMAHRIFNMFYGLKQQHIKPMCDRYFKGQKDFVDVQNKKHTKPTEFLIQFDFQTPKFPYMDFELINSTFFEKVDLSGRALSIAMVLVNTLAEMKGLLEYRNYVIAEINELTNKYNLGHYERACLYYGQPVTHTNLGEIHYENYSNVMRDIKIFNDSCIWFSKELLEELLKLEKETTKKVFIFRPKAGSIDFSDLEKDMMPDDNDYKDWREKFVKIK